MKRYLPHALGVLFVLLIMGGWALIARVAKHDNRAADCVSMCSVTKDTLVLDLWPDGLPSNSEIMEPEEELEWGTRLVQHPTLTIYQPMHPSGQAILVCPGGGYWVVCHHHEGADMSQWMNSRGITLGVLRYRMPNGHDRIPLEDGQRAMLMMRSVCREWGVKQVGIMGFSAGGHLASTIATHWTTEENKPDFQVLVYPVISMDTAITHRGSRDALLGTSPSDSLTRLYSNEMQVNTLTPPCFLALSGDDDLVPIANSLRYFQALQKAGVEVELNMYPTNGHGWGFNSTPFDSLWKANLSEFVSSQMTK